MMTKRTIQIDEDVWNELQRHAIPLVDTPNDVLRKLLKLGSTHTEVGTLIENRVQNMYTSAHDSMNYRTDTASKRVRSKIRKPFNAISQGDLVIPLCKLLQTLGGRASKREVEDRMYKNFETVFSDPYYQEIIAEGIPRWNKDVQWARNHAKDQGLIKPPSESGRGIWELTEQGRGV